MYRLLLIKRFIEDIFIFPFVLTGRLIAYLRPLKKEYQVFFFFPFFHTGGAEKIHAQIATAVGGRECILFFTRRSADDRFWNEFQRSGCAIKDISKFTDNKWLYFLNLVYRGVVTGFINRQKQRPIVFNGQSNFGYKISPWVKKGILQIELIHSLNSFSYIRIPFLPFISRTVMISQKRIADHKELYQRYNIPSGLMDKIVHIPNAIKLPDQLPSKNENPFTVLYAGRGTAEKRAHLVAEIARGLNEKNANMQFEVAGDVSQAIKEAANPFIKFYGNIGDENKLSEIYSKAHVLILTSSTEGFPMVIIEAMAFGCVVLSTPVGDIPYHIKNGENGYLFTETSNGQVIVKEATEKITWLEKNRSEWHRMSAINIEYAKQNFGIDRFNKEYRELFS